LSYLASAGSALGFVGSGSGGELVINPQNQKQVILAHNLVQGIPPPPPPPKKREIVEWRKHFLYAECYELPTVGVTYV